MKNIIEMEDLLIILFAGAYNSQDIAIEANIETGHMIMPIYRLN
jgi:hypothetical protein